MLSLALVASSAWSADWTVALDGSADFATLSDALDGASAGDTIRLSAGSYAPSTGERLPYYFPSGIVIQGGGPDVTVIDAEGADSFGRVVQPGVQIAGVTLRGARDTAIVVDSDLALSDCAFHDNGGNQYAAVTGHSVTVSDCAFSGNFAADANGAILYLDSGSTLQRVSVVETVSDGQLLVQVEGAVSCSVFSGGGVRVDTLENSLVIGGHGQENTVDDGACVSAAEATNNTIVGCSTVRALDATALALNNVIAHNAGAGLDGAYAAYNLLYDNVGGDFAGTDWTGQLGNMTGSDPLFRDFSDDGNWENDDFRLLDGSPALDAAAADFPAADIAGVPRPQDGDGDSIRRADIGAYEWGEFDADGDGWYLDGGDCDDTDPDVHPGADDRPYDGIDQDCDGRDLTDVDADGYDATYVGGDDCDDTDPGINPGAWDIPNDGIDQDCDGADAVDTDGDGWPDDQDCEPADPTVHPGADEACNGLDDDCNGEVDDGATCDTGGSDSGVQVVQGKQCACVGCRATEPSSALLFLPLVGLIRRRRQR